MDLRHLRQVASVAIVVVALSASTAVSARADDGPTTPACPAGASCAQSLPGAGTTPALVGDDGENGTMISEMVVIFGFLGVVWSVPYLVMRRRRKD